MKIYALKVNSTKEAAVIKELKKEGIIAIAPNNKKFFVKKDKSISEELEPLLRGYIFVLVDELTPVMSYTIKNTFNVQYILDSEIKDEEIQNLFDQEEITIETEIVKEKTEYRSLYGMIRKVIKSSKIKIMRKLSEMIDFELHKKLVNKIIKEIRYISIDDYNTIFN